MGGIGSGNHPNSIKNLKVGLQNGEAPELGRIGGIASGQAKKRKAEMKETLEMLLSIPIKKGTAIDTEKIKSFAETKGKNLSVEQAILLAQIRKALMGDTSAFVAIRDTSGNKPKDEMKFEGHIPVVISGEDELED